MEAAQLGRASSRSLNVSSTDSADICLQIVVVILFSAMWFTRRRDYNIFCKRSSPYRSSLDAPEDVRSTDELLVYDSENDDDKFPYSTTTGDLRKERQVLCLTVHTPNTSRFRNNIHSRTLQRYPFLIEMFYWVLNYAFYRMTRVLSQKIFGGSEIWQVAEEHGLTILQFEEFSWVNFLFPVREQGVQQWFMNGHQGSLTVLNRVYALIHIPGTVG